jgi:hypothetical protein
MMDCTINISVPVRAIVRDVAHPQHAISRLKKYIRENTVTVEVDTFLGYEPGGITIGIDKDFMHSNLDVEEHVTDPPYWMDKQDTDRIKELVSLGLLDKSTSRRLLRMIEETR